MEQKRVSFKVAQAIKEAGYPQEDCDEYFNKYGAIDVYLGYNIARPTYFDVWLWLWKVKKIKLMPTPIFDEMCNDIDKVGIVAPSCYIEADDPEEAIEKAVDYLVDNDLIK